MNSPFIYSYNDQCRETCDSHLIHHSGCLLCLQLLHALLYSVCFSLVVTFCAHIWWRMWPKSITPKKKKRTSLERNNVRRTHSSALGSCWRNHLRIAGPIATSVSRTSSGSWTPIYPSRNEPSPKFDARLVREEDRPELENLVVFGRGLRWCGAHSSKTSDEEGWEFVLRRG